MSVLFKIPQFKEARRYLYKMGMPKKNNELWTFFPIHKIPIPDFMNKNNPNNLNIQDNLNESKKYANYDFAELLPIANNAHTLVKNIEENTNEMAMIKCNNDFGHTILNIKKGAKVSLEILDNKVIHEIIAERFDINVGENAEVEIFFANPPNDLPLSFKHFHIEQAKNSNVKLLNIERGNGISRISADIFLQDEGAHFENRSLNILNKNTSSHYRIHIYHNAINTISEQFSRNILNENSYASYDGSVIVNENCSKTYSNELVNTILLSENASISVKPILKIYHDDVECTHGNTVGELDSEQLFYLISRGIPTDIAKKMLISSFAKEVFSPLNDSLAKKRLMQVLECL